MLRLTPRPLEKHRDKRTVEHRLFPICENQGRMRIKIRNVGEPVLRTMARPLTHEEIGSARIRELIEHMRETLSDAPGVGLAAPQIGEPLRLAIVEDKAEYQSSLTRE